MWKGKVPFDKETGNMICNPRHWVYGDRVLWKDYYTFEDTLCISKILRSGHVARFIAISNNEPYLVYPVFMSDVLDIIQHGIEPGGLVTGTWGFVKRGQNYGVCFVKGGLDG